MKSQGEFWNRTGAKGGAERDSRSKLSQFIFRVQKIKVRFREAQIMDLLRKELIWLFFSEEAFQAVYSRKAHTGGEAIDLEVQVVLYDALSTTRTMGARS